MKSFNAISVFIIGVMLAGCKADMICPAYQSYFLLDEDAQNNQFTYFALDSLPRRDIFNTTKDQNGLVAKTSLLAYVDTDWVRNREIRTIDMEVVYPQLSDSILFAGDAMMFAETDVVDTVALDSARMAAQTFKYGADQKYYNWYFRDKLVWKDELEKKEEKGAEKSEKKGIFSFIKGLLGKKDNLDKEAQPEGSTGEEEPQQKKSWLKGLFEKKEKQPKAAKEKKVKPSKEKKVEDPVIENEPSNQPAEDEDDGEDDF